MLTTTVHRHWYAVYVRHNTEFRVESWLREQGIEIYLPVQDVYREHAGKRIKVTKPVISGMLFVCLSRPELTIVEHAPNVHHFFSKRGTNAPLIIPDQQMADFRFMVDLSDTSILMVNEPIAPGTMVTVARGSMQGIRGEMVKYESKYYIAVRLQELGCALVSVPVSYVRRG